MLILWPPLWPSFPPLTVCCTVSTQTAAERQASTHILDVDGLVDVVHNHRGLGLVLVGGHGAGEGRDGGGRRERGLRAPLRPLAETSILKLSRRQFCTLTDSFQYIFFSRKLHDLSLVPLERASLPLSNGTKHKLNGGLDAKLWRVYGSRRFAHPPCVRFYVDFFSTGLQGSPLVPLDREKFPLSNGTKHVPNGRLVQKL